MKTETCKRCKGKGIGSWSVCHMGVPGVCFACDGSGQVVRLTKHERIDLFVAKCEKHQRELEQRAADEKAAVAQNPRRTEKGLIRQEAELERRLNQLRNTYRELAGAIREAVEADAIPNLYRQSNPMTYASRLQNELQALIESTTASV